MIYEKYIKEENFKFTKKENSNSDLIRCIIKTREDLEIANKNFEFAENELIDYYLYQIKAIQYKYDYLIKKAKKIGLIVTMQDELEAKNYNEAI